MILSDILNFWIFGAPKIDISSLEELKAHSPDIIVYAAPAMALFTLIEVIYSYYSDHKIYDTKETIGSVLTGVGSVLISLLLKTAIFYLVILVYNWIPWRMEFSWWSLIPCLIIYDMCSYWAHRTSHFNRFFWATHIVHHSGENYNLTVSFRLSWIQHFKLLFFMPVAFFGFHPIIFFVTNQISVLFQFWQHTEYIKKLHPAIEYLFVTPSNHRVHHGSDDKYRDKNFGAVFMVWDRILGTYQPEEERPTYGITTKLDETLNPLYINFHEVKDIIKDVKKAKGFRTKMFFLFGSPATIAMHKKGQEEAAKAQEADAPVESAATASHKLEASRVYQVQMD